MEGLPLLPGYAFHDPTIRDFKLRQKFAYKNGFRVLRDSDYGVGGRPIDAASSAYATGYPDLVEYDPSLTYGRVREYGYSQVIPDYALFAQKCLNFKAFFRQGVFNSPDEHYRIRHVNIIYYLEDDTMCVMEPPVENSGFKQGKLVRRGKIVKDSDGRFYNWKDLNVGIEIGIYGVAYRIVDCDLFTREFLQSQGVDVGEKEEAPQDPYTQRLIERENRERNVGHKLSCGSDDTRRRFLEYDRMILRFDATWNNDDYQIMYYLTDDTIAIREIHRINDGKDPSSLLLKRTKVPKNWTNLPSTYPAIYLECSDSEVLEYYTPKDLKIGETIFVFGRRFLLLDCDTFTRKYYSGMLGIAQPAGMRNLKKSSCEKTQQQLPPPPPHIAFGTPEDTLATCQSFVPKSPKKDVIRQLYNFPKKLRYLATMEAVHPEDEDRDFIIEYSLSDGKITISEIEKRNSGRRGGCFLSPTLIPKPSTGRDNPLYYTPEDFFIDAKINVFNHRFIVKGIDLFVYRYVEANPEKFSCELRDNLRNYVVRQGMLEEEIERGALKDFAAQEEIEESKNMPVSSRDDPVKDSTEESLRLCEKELSANVEEDKTLKSASDEERCREMLLRDTRDESAQKTCDFVDYSASKEAPTALPEEKHLSWADQIDKDSAGHPIVSCCNKMPEHTKRAVRRSSLKNRCNTKLWDKRFQVISSSFSSPNYFFV